MDVSEDGTVTGSINVSELESVEPKTDEAKAQIEGLKARIQEGQEQADSDAESQAETAAAQDNTVQDEQPKDEAPKADEGKSVKQFGRKGGAGSGDNQPA